MTKYQKTLKEQIEYYRREILKAKDKEIKVFNSGIVFGLKLAFNLNSKTPFDKYDTFNKH